MEQQARKLFYLPLPSGYALGLLTIGLVLGLLTFLEWKGVSFTYQEPSLVLLTFSILWILASGLEPNARAPASVFVFWLIGAVSLIWSVAPGNTVIYSLWELSFVACFLLGYRFPKLYWPLNLALIGFGLQTTLSLNIFGLQQYFSGSLHYVAGAQALLVIPLALVYSIRSRNRKSSILWHAIALLSLYLALASGARAVYLPLLLVLSITLVRLAWTGSTRRRLWFTGIVLTLSLVSLDLIIPHRPISTALGTKASIEAQAASSKQHGGFSQRLRYWDQAFDVVLDMPLGSGVGSYQATAHHYQKYPMVWSNSPHNYYLETLATGGWMRFGLLLFLLLPPLWRGWTSQMWPWSVAVAGFWITLAVDVTSYYPSFMMVAFMTLGVLYAVLSHNTSPYHTGWSPATWVKRRALLAATAVVSVVGGLWWFWPCNSSLCSVERYLGVDYKVFEALREATPVDRTKILDRTLELYPKSSWVIRAKQLYVESDEGRLLLAREFALRYPYQHPDNYKDWAEAALALGHTREASEAIKSGLSVFSPNNYPYGERRMTREVYDQWLGDAERLLERAELTPD